VGDLDALGLSDTEQAVYRALVDSGPHPVAALRGAVPAADPAPAVARLQDLGLVRPVPGDPDLVAAAPPELALRPLLAAAEAELARARGAVAALLAALEPAAATSAGVVEIVTDPDRVIRTVARVQREARRELCVFDRPPYTGDPLDNPVERERLANGVRCRAVYDRASMAVPGRLAHLEAMAHMNEDARVVPEVPIKMVITDDRLALVPLRGVSDIGHAVLVRPSPLLDALRRLFEVVWRRAVPLRLVIAVGSAAALDADQRRLLALLATGADDDEIGRRLGLSARTLHRRIGALMATLGVRTRFQLGVAANRRGWL